MFFFYGLVIEDANLIMDPLISETKNVSGEKVVKRTPHRSAPGKTSGIYIATVYEVRVLDGEPNNAGEWVKRP